MPLIRIGGADCAKTTFHGVDLTMGGRFFYDSYRFGGGVYRAVS